MSSKVFLFFKLHRCITEPEFADWAYLLYPSIELLRTPWSNLLSQVRSALAYLKENNREKALEWDCSSRSTAEEIPSKIHTVTHLNSNRLEKGRQAERTFKLPGPLDVLPGSVDRRNRLDHKLDTAAPLSSVHPSHVPRVFLVGRLFNKPGTETR